MTHISRFPLFSFFSESKCTPPQLETKHGGEGREEACFSECSEVFERDAVLIFASILLNICFSNRLILCPEDLIKTKVFL